MAVKISDEYGIFVFVQIYLSKVSQLQKGARHPYKFLVQ